MSAARRLPSPQCSPGSAVSEVGAVILVGGNIRGQTRTMSTAIALQTSQGYLPMALGLGAVLVGLSIAGRFSHSPEVRGTRAETRSANHAQGILFPCRSVSRCARVTVVQP